MLKHLVPIALAMCITTTARTQQLNITIARAADTSEVVLESTDLKKLPLKETDALKVKWYTIPLVGARATAFFQLPLSAPEFVPSKIILGKSDPEKGWSLRLVRMEENGKEATFKVKLKLMSMYADKDSEPYPGEEFFKSEKNSDGIYFLKLPKPLSEGLYAIAMVKGSVATPFNTLTAKALMFRVPKTSVQPSDNTPGTASIAVPPTQASPTAPSNAEPSPSTPSSGQ